MKNVFGSQVKTAGYYKNFCFERKQLGAIVYGEQYVVIDSSGIVLQEKSFSTPGQHDYKWTDDQKLSVGEKSK